MGLWQLAVEGQGRRRSQRCRPDSCFLITNWKRWWWEVTIKCDIDKGMVLLPGWEGQWSGMGQKEEPHLDMLHDT